MRTTLQIRKADEALFVNLKQKGGDLFNFSEFVSDMLNKHGIEWLNKRIEKINKES